MLMTPQPQLNRARRIARTVRALPASCGQVGILGDGNVLNIAASQDGARLLLMMMARPLKEPIMRHGPFVMTSHAEITQAFTDYQNGLF